MGNLSLGFWAIAFFLLGSLIDAADGSIHEYKNENFTKIENAWYFYGGNEVIYGSEFLDVGASSDTAPLKGKSFIRFEDLSFVRSKESANKQNSTQTTAGLVEAILFEFNQLDDGSCNLGEVIISPDPNAPGWPKRIPTFFKKGEEQVKMSPESVAINKTGRYYVKFISCDPELDGITIRGRIVWKNLDGYLPGEKTPLWKLNTFMCLAYVLLSLAWFPLLFKHWNQRILLHYHITLVIVLAICELGLRYLEFNTFNTTGVSLMGFTYWEVIITSLKMALSRFLVLAICTGHGVMKPIVGDIVRRMLFLAVICSVLDEALRLVRQYPGDISEGLGLIIMFFYSVVETRFVLWSYSGLWRIIKKLKQDNKTNMAKLRIYRMFKIALVTMMFLNFSVFYITLFYIPMSEFWQLKWITSASWYILTYATLALICFFWAPSEKPTRYLYVAEKEEDFEDELKEVYKFSYLGSFN